MGNHLSGGEQQMLAIGRALMLCPKLLILDEATEGLAPTIREKIWTCLQSLKDAGLSILLIDKNLDELAPLADRTYIMEKGRMVWEGSTAKLIGTEELRLRYLGV
jgi:branched-chain amino acid transport system ATP-binding protein